MQLAVMMMLVAGLGIGVALAGLQAGYSAWAAFGIYALTIDVVALACLIGGALIRKLVALWTALAPTTRSGLAPSSPELSR